MIQKLPLTRITDTDLLQYFLFLTVYAFVYVNKQFEIKSKSLSSITVNVCGCRFNVAIKLLCHHIFYLRSTKNNSLYKEKLCSICWIKKYYHQHQRVFQTSPTVPQMPNKLADADNEVNLKIVTTKTTKLSSNDKFRNTSNIGSKIIHI